MASTGPEGIRPEGRYVELPGGASFCREAGQGAPTIVLLHGLPVDSRIYSKLQPILAQRHRTLAPDFLGWGESRPNQALTFGFDALDRNLAQLIDSYGLDDVVLVAHDMSGPAAIRWAAANAARTRALVLLNTYYGWNSARMPPALKLMHLPYLGRLARRFIGVGRRGLSWQLYRWQVGTLWAHRTPEVERVLRSFHSVFERSPRARAAFHAINDELVSQIDANQRRLEVLTELRSPTLIVWGARDRYMRPAVARQFHRVLPCSELNLIPEAGHFVHMETPQETARVIESFLSGLGARGAAPS